MIAWLMSSRLVQGALAALAVVGAVSMALARRDARVRREVEAEGIKDAAKRVEAGRAAVADGRDSGTPDERVRRNDGRWR